MLFRSALVFAAHPDDEIMMAGTIARMADEGTQVAVVQMTDGCEGYPEPEMKDTIVELRRAEAEACNRVLGIARRHHLGRPDMALVNDKPTLLDLIEIVRSEKPEAAFIQGPHTLHRDHINTCNLALEALWHAGEPVAAERGAPWSTPEIYLYFQVKADCEPIAVDVSGYGHKWLEALATQESQFTLFQREFGMGSREEFEREIERLRTEGGRDVEHFWIARQVADFEGLPDPKAHRLAQWARQG